jgi:hypothetical protein
MIGVVDIRVAAQAPELIGSLALPAQIGQGRGYKVHAIRWHVFGTVVADSDGLDAEGLLLEPQGQPQGPSSG